MSNLSDVTDIVNNLYSSFASAKKQSLFQRDYAGEDGRFGRITEFFQRITLAQLARYAIKEFGGGLVEVGVANGNTSTVLADVARGLNQQLLCVDPFLWGVQEATEAIYDEFLTNIKPYPNITHLRAMSQSEEGAGAIIDFKPSLIFVDGDHRESYAYADIAIAYHALPVGGVVVVDDTNFMNKDAGKALQTAINEGGFDLVVTPPDIEESLFRSYKSWHVATKRNVI